MTISTTVARIAYHEGRAAGQHAAQHQLADVLAGILTQVNADSAEYWDAYRHTGEEYAKPFNYGRYLEAQRIRQFIEQQAKAAGVTLRDA